MALGKKVIETSYECVKLTADCLRGVNTTIWGGAEGAKKVGTIIKTGLSGADVVIGTSHAIEDFNCNDPVCGTLDVIASASSLIGMVLGNISATKHLTMVTGSVTVGCRSIRYYCKQYVVLSGVVLLELGRVLNTV